MQQVIRAGADALVALDEAADFVEHHSVAYCTGTPWLQAAAQHLPGEPVVITVGAGGTTDGLAALTRRRRHGVWWIELLGGDLNDYGQFHVEDAAAAMLADAVVGWVRTHRHWVLDLAQLAPDDPVAARIRALLPNTTVCAGPAMPRIENIDPGFRVSRNRRRQIANAKNRLAADGHDWRWVTVDDAAQLEPWLDRAVEVRRRRDHSLGRRSHLDNEPMRAFYRATVRDIVTRGRGVLDLVVVGESVLGYCVVVFDGGTHRMIDARVAEDWKRYRGGSLCDIQALVRAANDPCVRTFDWLRGEDESKVADARIRRVAVRAVSSRWVEVPERSQAALRRGVKALLPAALVRRLVDR